MIHEMTRARAYRALCLAIKKPCSFATGSTVTCGNVERSAFAKLERVNQQSRCRLFHSTPLSADGQRSKGGSGEARKLDGRTTVHGRPVKISMTELDKPDFMDLADVIMSGKSYKEAVAGTEFDNLDPAIEEDIEEAKRRMSALQHGALEDYLLSKDETDLLEELKSLDTSNIKEAQQVEPNFQIPQYVEMAQGDWSELLVHTDRVQKTVKGGMEVSYRALVVAGNLHGAGGFAIGKSSNPGDAVLEASRKAKLPKNLVYVERYKQACLYQDVVGKHNGCKAYIWARPPGYGMRASGLMRQILYNIGITDAGCKIVGNRNKYSMIYAIFNALAKHRGLETIAKARGKRILTLHRSHELWS